MFLAANDGRSTLRGFSYSAVNINIDLVSKSAGCRMTVEILNLMFLQSNFLQFHNNANIRIFLTVFIVVIDRMLLSIVSVFLSILVSLINDLLATIFYWKLFNPIFVGDPYVITLPEFLDIGLVKSNFFSLIVTCLK